MDVKNVTTSYLKNIISIFTTQIFFKEVRFVNDFYSLFAFLKL